MSDPASIKRAVLSLESPMPLYRIRTSQYIRQTSVHVPTCPFVQYGNVKGRHPTGDEMVDHEASNAQQALLAFEMEQTQSLPVRMYKVCRCAGGETDEIY
jgi:hypothetical protein